MATPSKYGTPITPAEVGTPMSAEPAPFPTSPPERQVYRVLFESFFGVNLIFNIELINFLTPGDTLKYRLKTLIKSTLTRAQLQMTVHLLIAPKKSPNCHHRTLVVVRVRLLIVDRRLPMISS